VCSPHHVLVFLSAFSLLGGEIYLFFKTKILLSQSFGWGASLDAYESYLIARVGWGDPISTTSFAKGQISTLPSVMFFK